jgi:hypothetical protein
MAGKNPAKLAEAGKGCSLRCAGALCSRKNNHFVSMT